MAVILSKKKKKNLSIDIHPAAYAAYELYHSLGFMFDKTQLGTELLDRISQAQIYRAVYLTDDKIGLISGFEIVGFSLPSLKRNDVKILLEKDINEDEITMIAWSGVLRVLFSSVDSSSLELMRQALNLHAPDSIRRVFFNNQTLTQKHLSNFANISVSGLKKQRKNRLNSAVNTLPKPDIFSVLKERFDDN